MKKLLILLMVLALIIFSLYPEDIDGMETSTKAKVAQEFQIKEKIVKEYYNSKNEINPSSEVNETIEEEFSVEIKGDLNTTKETVITLTAVVKNAQNLEACNYFWYEGKELIDMGATLEKAFDKGEHNIVLVVKDANGTETNSSVVVRAYNYKSITKLNYDAHYGQLLYSERRILNHKNQYILNDDGIYSKVLLTYDKDGMMIERVREYYNNPKGNRKTEFTYDDKGNRLVSQTFNREGLSIDYVLRIYDDNSSLIDMKFGRNADDVNEYKSIVYQEVPSDGMVYTEPKVPEDVVELNDNGQIIYEENYYGDTKVVTKMTYNEENKLIKSERSNNSSYDSSLTIMEYDAKGNSINTEKKYEMKGYGSCHYSSANTFTDLGQVKSSVSTLLGGECDYIDDVKRVYSYDQDGSVINVKSTTDGEELSEAHTTLEVIKEYINELDI